VTPALRVPAATQGSGPVDVSTAVAIWVPAVRQVGSSAVDPLSGTTIGGTIGGIGAESGRLFGGPTSTGVAVAGVGIGSGVMCVECGVGIGSGVIGCWEGSGA
jgi:hypothetical protein